MKGAALITMMLALLLAMYLVLRRMQEPAAPGVLGNAPMVDAPAATREKVGEAMKVEEDRQRELEKEMEAAQ